jgi:DNA-binding XRE family transcriptional regulator
MSRPTKYKADYAEQARKLCLLGATDAELAEFFEVSESTLNLWKKEHDAFSESIKKGKAQADADVADRLYQRAMGYEHPEVDIRVVSGEIVKTPITKIYAPDPTAAIFWLKNRQKAKWRDKIEQEVTGADGGPLVVEITRFGSNPPA